MTAVSIQGHGYLQTPRSRNFVANQDGKDFGGGPNDPAIEYCPHCLNVVGKYEHVIVLQCKLSLFLTAVALPSRFESM